MSSCVYGNNAGFAGLFGSGVYPSANVVNALQILTTGASGYTSGTLSLYGIRYS